MPASANRAPNTASTAVPKKVEGEHVPKQMHVIFMDESGGDKPIVLTVSMY